MSQAAQTTTGGGNRPGTDRGVQIVPSVLPADFSRLGEECQALEEAGVDRIQWDVMDGRFVPNLTFGADVIGACRSQVKVPFEAHLMIEEPDVLIPSFIEAGCELIIVHAETTRHLHKTLDGVRQAGAKAAVALNPATPNEVAYPILDLVEMVLIMTVNPGFGGQSFISSMVPKVAELRNHIVAAGLDIDIEVDGGINTGTIASAYEAGANVLVAGSALYKDPEGLGHAVSELRALATS